MDDVFDLPLSAPARIITCRNIFPKRLITVRCALANVKQIKNDNVKNLPSRVSRGRGKTGKNNNNVYI